MSEFEHPKVFISYCWTNNKYVEKVVKFARSLREDGIDVKLDQFHLKPGNDVNDFMEKCITDPSIKNVLILLSPDYKIKADSRKGGTGTETQIISGEVYSKVDNTKFIPIIFDKNGEEIDKCIPIYLRQRRWIDMSDESNYNEEYVELVKLLYGKSKYVENPLGNKPKWVDDDVKIEVNNQKFLNSFKVARKQYNVETAIYTSFDFIKNSILDVKQKLKEINDFDFNDFEIYYSEFYEIRDNYLSMLDEIKYDIGIGEKIHTFLTNFLKIINENNFGFNLFAIYGKFVIHELFIETISILYKSNNFNAINYIAFTPYIVNLFDSDTPLYFHEVFYSLNDTNVYNLNRNLIFQLSKNGDKRVKYCSGIAEYWRQHLPIKYVNIEEFANADCLLTNLSILLNKNFWFAVSYLFLPDYGNCIIEDISISLKSKRLAIRLYPLFNCNNSDDLKNYVSNFKKIFEEKGLKFGYYGVYKKIPLIIDNLNESEIETKI